MLTYRPSYLRERSRGVESLDDDECTELILAWYEGDEAKWNALSDQLFVYLYGTVRRWLSGAQLYCLTEEEFLNLTTEAANWAVEKIRGTGLSSTNRFEPTRENAGFKKWVDTITRNRLQDLFTAHMRTVKGRHDMEEVEKLRLFSESEEKEFAWDEHTLPEIRALVEKLSEGELKLQIFDEGMEQIKELDFSKKRVREKKNKVNATKATERIMERRHLGGFQKLKYNYIYKSVGAAWNTEFPALMERYLAAKRN